MCSTPGLPTAGTVVPVLITGVNLKHGSGIVELWVNMDDDKKHIYEQMRGEIQDPDRKFAGPEGEPGDLCLVCIDGVWHRAQIVSIQGDTCNVFLIDQGQPHITRSKALAWGHTDSFLLPPETESCILANVLLLDNIWPERAIKFLMSLHGKKFKGLVQHVLKPNRTLLLDIPMVSKPMCMFGVAKKMPVDEFKCLVQKCLEVDRITQEPNLNVGRKLEKIDQYFYPDLLTNSYEAVIVTEVNNPRNIFCKLNIFSKAVKMISEQMQQHYENDSGETGPSNCGDPCAAKGTDGRWHRSLLRQTLTNDGTVQVFHVDEGKVEMVPVGGIRPLHRDFLRMPVVTYSCSLQGVTDDRMAKTSYLKSLLLNQTHMAKFSHHNKPQDVYQYTDEEEANKVASLAQEAGLAQQDRTFPESLCPGSPCLALDSNDGQWYRAQVLRRVEDKFDVVFVDYGNESDVDIKNVRSVPQSLLEIAPQAFLCSLKGFDQSSGSWDDQVHDVFYNLLVDKPLNVTVLNKEELSDSVLPQYAVEIVCENVIMNTVMQKYWTPLPTEQAKPEIAQTETSLQDLEKESNKDLEKESDKDTQTESDKDNQKESNKDLETESDKDNQTESDKDNQTESDKDNQKESNKDLDTESNKDLDTESNKDNQTESNKDLDTESNKDLDTESNKDNQTESNKDLDTESNKELETESNKDNQTESDKDNQTESDKDNQKESNKDLETESDKDNQTESDKDNQTESDKDNQKESNKDLDTESNKDLDTESNKDLDTESNKDLDTESNKDNQTESNKDLDTESNKDLDTESNKDNQTESIKDLDTESNKDLDTESNKDNQTESNKDLDTESNKDLDSESNKDNQTESNKDLDTESNKDLDTKSNKDNQTESNKDLDTESNKDLDTESNKDNQTESNKDLDTESNKDNQMESNKDLDTESNKDLDTDSNKDDQKESNKDLDTESNKDDQTESNKDLDTESNKDDQTESNKDLDTESNKDDQTESNKDLDTESNKDLDTDSNKDDQTESNKDLDTESNKDLDTDSNKDDQTESNKDLDTESNKDNQMESNKDLDTESSIDLETESSISHLGVDKLNVNTCMYKKPNISKNQQEVYASCISDPHFFWCQYSDEEEANKVTSLAQEAGLAQQDRTFPESLCPGSPCLALDSSDGQWYRAQVLRRVEDKFDVVFVDHGNKSDVDIKNVRSVPQSLLEIALQAFLCSPKGFDQSRGSWHDQVHNVFYNLLVDNPLNVTVLNKEELSDSVLPQYAVEIVCENVIMNTVMQKYWTPLPTEQAKPEIAQTETSLQDLEKESNKDLETESDKDLDTESSIDLETESDKDTQKESNKELETESNKDLDTKSSIDLETESDKDTQKESNKELETESNKDLDTKSSMDLETESSISHLGVDKLNVNTCMYKKPNISKNQQEVYASCISDPHFFWCQYTDEEEANKVTSLAQEAGLAQQDRTFPESLCPGSPCLALDSSDGQWYRAQVLRRVEDKFDVVFVDYGNKSDVDIKNVRSVPQSLLEIAPQAFLCSLKGFDQSRGSWDDQVHDVFYNLLVDNPLKVTVLDMVGHSEAGHPQYAVEVECEGEVVNALMQTYWNGLDTGQASGICLEAALDPDETQT
ncbi:hypothetical protein PBY51_011225 [Eleginops maclovinus]|uniref:Tudor domain-containing protein n=1 Tax=Eleginops maclovinus TaxID=56733 RepID=A0AAN7XE73_ELEMC|nr:hypothetical protein PBY51_011225 [Eleginops maclovinus]